MPVITLHEYPQEIFVRTRFTGILNDLTNYLLKDIAAKYRGNAGVGVNPDSSK